MAERKIHDNALRVSRAAVRLCIMLIQAYQFSLRPLLVGSCKFHPSCSAYGIEALQRYGLCRGLWLALKRLCRCHPFGAGGIDPVP